MPKYEDEFRADKQVRAFVEWCLQPAPSVPEGSTCRAPRNLWTLPVTLHLRESDQVPRVVRPVKPVPFGLLVPRFYVWRAPGMISGSWQENSLHIQRLHDRLVGSRAQPDLLATCKDVLHYAGDVNLTSEAWRMLQDLARFKGEPADPDDPFCPADGDTIDVHLRNFSAVLRLCRTYLNNKVDRVRVPAMDSMMAKIHSLDNNNGLPSYDSRIAGAIATVIETWRRAQKVTTPLSPNLVFPAVGDSNRSVRERYPDISDDADPGVLHAGAADALQWARAMVRLHLLSQELLGHSCPPSRLRKFEASLFIAGFDVAGINWPPRP